MQPSPDGFFVQTDLAGYLPDSVAVHQPEIKHLAVGFVMDHVHDQRLDLSVGILRAR